MEKELNKKARYNLNVVVQETGIKPDALRAWEKRYDLPQPGRSDGGHRLYSDYDIQVIKWLKARQDEGMRISQAVKYWRELIASEINPLVEVPLDRSDTSQPAVGDVSHQTVEELRDNWIEACLDYQEIKADQIMTQAFAQFPMDLVCTELIGPALNKIGELWYQGDATVQQEHFASELVIRKLQALLTTAPMPLHNKMILIACPPGEIHTIPILIFNLLLRYRGWETLYLGANVPVNKLADTVVETKPDLAVLNATRLPTAATLLESIQVLNDLDVQVAFSGRVFSEIEGLADLLPGHYLSGDLKESIQKIEALVLNPTQAEFEKIVPLNGIEDSYKKYRYAIDRTVMDYFSTKVSAAILDDIIEGNQYLYSLIKSALKLGDLELINPELIWLVGLLNKRAHQPDLMIIYLEQYQNAVDSRMGKSGELISNWLENKINTYKEEG